MRSGSGQGGTSGVRRGHHVTFAVDEFPTRTVRRHYSSVNSVTDFSLRGPPSARCGRRQTTPPPSPEEPGARSLAAISRRSLDFDAPPGRGRSGKENTLTLGPDGTLSKADAKRLQILLSGKRPQQRKHGGVQKKRKKAKRQFKAAHGCPACAGRHRAHTCGRGR